jgi:hypothetical protein
MMVYHILSMDKLYGCPYSHFLFWLHLAHRAYRHDYLDLLIDYTHLELQHLSNKNHFPFLVLVNNVRIHERNLL